MKQVHYLPFTVIALAAAALLVCAGCAPTPDAKSTVDSMTEFGNDIAKANDSIDGATGALATLVNSQAADIKPNLDSYSKALTALERQTGVVRADGHEMTVNGDSFFTKWEGAGNISPDRRAELSASYAKIKQDMASAKEGFTPFLASLQDIQSYLSLDPTVTGINSVSGMVTKAKANGADVKSRLDEVLTQMNSVRGMLSTK